VAATDAPKLRRRADHVDPWYAAVRSGFAMPIKVLLVLDLAILFFHSTFPFLFPHLIQPFLFIMFFSASIALALLSLSGIAVYSAPLVRTQIRSFLFLLR
jgi:uncharacterized membrane protein YjjP (DUF1212 family)